VSARLPLFLSSLFPSRFLLSRFNFIASDTEEGYYHIQFSMNEKSKCFNCAYCKHRESAFK
jgi:hypothetical protein